MSKHDLTPRLRTYQQSIEGHTPLHSQVGKRSPILVCGLLVNLLLCFSAAASDALPAFSSINDRSLQYHAAFENTNTAADDSNAPANRVRSLDYYEEQLERANNPVTTPDFDGLLSDSKYFIYYQIGALAVIYFLPENISGWSDEQKHKNRWEAYKDNVGRVVWDKDLATINYIGHPYFGATYYIRAIERGYDPESAFVYAATLSTIYEFGIEALFEEPSIQDMFVTPIMGSILGYFFNNARNNIRARGAARGHFTGWERFMLGFTDPLGWVNSKTDKLFNKDVEVTFVPGFKLPPQAFRLDGKPDYTLRPQHLTWGVQMIVKW